jgi:sphingomyelin phosphodiesterase acid-like 3
MSSPGTRSDPLRSYFARHAALAALAIALAIGLCGTASGQQAPPAEAAGQVLVMSDLHFDPMADPSLVDQLAAAEPEQWSAVLDSSSDRSLGRYGRDSNWMLLRFALQHMAKTLPKPALVLIPGDFLAHRFREEFDAAAKDHSDAAYRIFVRKTMQFLGEQLEQNFPATPILPALGNNDEECGDYQLQPNGPFLADTLPILRRLVGSAGAPGFDRDWQSYGNYSARVSSIRILSTNTNFLSVHYRNLCGSPADGDPGNATLAWLEAELAAAKEAREPVWLVYHIPPGIDGYATLRQGACPGTMIPMWDQAYPAVFLTLLKRYADTIAASFAGHTHMDDFRLIGDAEGRYGFALITPAVSPIFGQNPAFRTVVYGPQGGILDQTTYDLTNLPQATAAVGGVPPEWRAEYTFTRQWGLPRVDLASLDHLYTQITDVPAQREQWQIIFPVSSPVYWVPFSGGSGQLAQAVRAFRCASGNLGPSDYGQCYCSSQN